MSDVTGEVISLTLAWPRCKTLGELGVANALAAAGIMPMVMAELHELIRLHRAGQIGSGTAQRHAIVTGALVTRLCFEVYGLSEEAQSVVPAA